MTEQEITVLLNSSNPVTIRQFYLTSGGMSYDCRRCGQKQQITDRDHIFHGWQRIGVTQDGVATPLLCIECSMKWHACNSCNKWFFAPGTGSTAYCLSCVANGEPCECCGDRIPLTSLTEVNGHKICNTCHECLNYCDVCHNTFFNVSYIQDMAARRELIIPEWVHDSSEEFLFDDWNTWCSQCEVTSNRIHSYGFNPKPEFKHLRGERSPLYFGVELEVETINDPREDAEHVDCTHVYLKSDSSIENGFEIVSHPFTYQWFKANTKYWSSILALRRKGFKSYSTNSCGMHVHMTRDAFTTLQLFKFMKLFYDFPVFTLWMSRRAKSNLEYWAGTSKNESNIKKKAKFKRQDGDRHVAVAISHHAPTIEVRIFRGTLGIESFCANIEFCKAAFDYCNESSMQVSPDEFFEFVLRNSKYYPHFATFVAKRRGRYYTMLERAKREGNAGPSKNGSNPSTRGRRSYSGYINTPVPTPIQPPMNPVWSTFSESLTVEAAREAMDEIAERFRQDRQDADRAAEIGG